MISPLIMGQQISETSAEYVPDQKPKMAVIMMEEGQDATFRSFDYADKK